MFVKGFLEDLFHSLNSVTENVSIILLAGGKDENSKLASAESISNTNTNLETVAKKMRLGK